MRTPIIDNKHSFVACAYSQWRTPAERLPTTLFMIVVPRLYMLCVALKECGDGCGTQTARRSAQAQRRTEDKADASRSKSSTIPHQKAEVKVQKSTHHTMITLTLSIRQVPTELNHCLTHQESISKRWLRSYVVALALCDSSCSRSVPRRPGASGEHSANRPQCY